jgi:formylglycine-generating enzyme required for sulfatase activity
MRKRTVFISYSSKDKNFAEKLAADLRASGAGVWFDQWEIRVGDSITQKINDGIHDNDYLAVVLSPDSVTSPWVRKELNAAMMKELDRRSVFVLPILYRDCEIPALIADKHYADFRKSYEAGFSEILRVLAPEEEEVRPGPRPAERRHPARPRRPVNWERVGAIAGVIGVIIALGVWLVPNAADFLSAWLFETPTVTPPVLPKAVISGPMSGLVGETLSFSGAGSSDEDGHIIALYAWDFGDGTTGSGVNVTHTYRMVGSYQVTLTVTDNYGLSDIAPHTVQINESVTENQPPKAVISGPTSGSVGETLSFSGADSFDEDGYIVSYAWDFGDGTTGSGVNVTHVYTVPGSYQVTLTVTDNGIGTYQIVAQAIVSTTTTPKVTPTVTTPGGLGASATQNILILIIVQIPPEAVIQEPETPSLSALPGMVYVPAGEFIMGSSDADVNSVLALCNEVRGDCERSWYEDEQPQHTVYLDAFYIDETEVTSVQFAQFLNEQGNQEEGGVTWLDIGDENCRITESGGQYQPKTGYSDHPVIEVSWYGARAYCQWAGKRLPTEAEWERAARGTDGLMYPWGNTFDGTKLNFADKNTSFDWSDPNWDDGYAGTAPVCSYPDGASPYGALDMAGNVYEWVADWYESGYYVSSPESNPEGPVSGDYRVIRGGSWYDIGTGVRAADRDRRPPIDSISIVGFRCAR